MLIIIAVLAFIALVLMAAFFALHRYIWIPLIGGGLVYITSFSPSSVFWWFIPFWLLFAMAVVGVLLTPLRRQYLTKPILYYLRRHLPSMSQTEKEALEAGDVWVEGDLFQGKPNWKSLLKLRQPRLTDEEQAFMDQQVATLCNMVCDWQAVKELNDLAPEVWQYLKKEGFFALVISKEYGGKGFSAYAHSCIVTQLATRSISLAVTVMVPNSLGPAELLGIYGTDDQKKHYLPRLASGEDIPCFALTATDAGSDAASIVDSGEVCLQSIAGKDVLGIKINCDKRYITLAPVATLIGIAFRLRDPQNLLGKGNDIGITLALVPRDTKGLEVGVRHAPMNLAFMNGPVRAKDAFIPIDNIIGGEAMAGKGWTMMMEALAIGRAISIPALATALSQVSYITTGAYARLREQFRTPIGYFEGVEEALARIAGLTYINEAARQMTADAVGQNIRPSLVSAITKYHLTENCRQVTDAAMDVQAGKALQLGPNNYLGLGYQAVPVSITVEGANILTRSLIIFGQGAMRCHPYIRTEMDLAHPEGEVDIKAFDQVLMAHAGYKLTNFARTFVYGLSAGRLARAPAVGIARKYVRQINRMSAALAFVSDIAMLSLGGALKRKERISARLGDVLSHLYLATAVVKYYHDNKHDATENAYVEWALTHSLGQIQIAFDNIFVNFPNRILGAVLKRIVFPWGAAYRQPSDKLDQQVAQASMSMDVARQRISRFLHRAKSPVGEVDAALAKLIANQDLYHKLHAAIKNGTVAKTAAIHAQIEQALQHNVISEAEAQQLTEVEMARAQVIAVDEFKS